jgi:hypothetical protein
VVVNSRGEYAYTGQMHNSGFVALKFVAAAVLHGNAQAFVIPAHSATTQGHNPLSGDEHTNVWRESGSDPTLREHWSTVKSCGLKVRVDIGVEAGEVIALVLTGIFIVGVVVFLAAPGDIQSRRCPDGTTLFWHQGQPPPDCNRVF